MTFNKQGFWLTSSRSCLISTRATISITSIAFLLISFQFYGQGSEYYTAEEIEEMRTRMKDLGYDSDFINKSLAPYIDKASIKLEKTTFTGKYNKKYQQLKISNCSEIEGEDFCTKYITINGARVELFISTNHVVFNLRPLDLDIGSEVDIVIHHSVGCTPLITNPQDFK